MLTKVTQRCW